MQVTTHHSANTLKPQPKLANKWTNRVLAWRIFNFLRLQDNQETRVASDLTDTTPIKDTAGDYTDASTGERNSGSVFADGDSVPSSRRAHSEAVRRTIPNTISPPQAARRATAREPAEPGSAPSTAETRTSCGKDPETWTPSSPDSSDRTGTFWRRNQRWHQKRMATSIMT